MIQMIQNRLRVTFFICALSSLKTKVTAVTAPELVSIVLVIVSYLKRSNAVVVPSPSSRGPLVQGVLKHQIRYK